METTTMTNLQKAEAVVQQLQNKAQELLQADVWDNEAIEANARMLSTVLLRVPLTTSN